ncbi:T9SS type A sorting domain-containing protein [Flavobacterium piscinae]|nr:T9SS type A sorting domain-containing protein [Flavobacterium piscinae]
MKKILLLALGLAINYNTSAQVFNWVRTTGGTAGETASKIATDALGNVYTLGSYTGTLDINPSSGTLNVTAVGGTDIYIQKFDASGTFINGISIGGPGNDVPGDILIDNNGYVTVSGTFEQFIDLDPSPAQNGHAVFNFGTSKDFFIAKYDDLAYAFSKAIGGAGDDIVNAMDVDSNNNIVLTGIYRQTVDFNPNVSVTNSLTTTAGGEAYVLKLNENLDYVWVKSFATSDTNGNVGNSIKVDNSGNIIVGGTFRGLCDFDPSAGTTQNETAHASFSAGFIVKLTSEGNYTWKASLNTTNNNISGNNYSTTPETFLRDIAIDGNDNVIAVGSFRGRIVDFNPSPVATNLIDSDINFLPGTPPSPDVYTYLNTGFLWKLNPSGNYLWAGAVRTPSQSILASVNPFAITLDNNNDFYFTGHFKYTIDINPASGNTSLTSTGNNDVFIGKFNGTTNALIWARSFGGSNNVYTNDMKISNGKMLFSGRFAASVDFDPNSGTQSVSSQGGEDSYLLSLTETSLNTASFEKNDFLIYPNPVIFELTIQSVFNNYHYKVYTADGKLVKQGTFDETTNSIDVSTLTSGLYFIHFESDGYQTTHKIIKQ